MTDNDFGKSDYHDGRRQADTGNRTGAAGAATRSRETTALFWTAVFWLCLLGLVYVYAGYPLSAWLLGGLLNRRVQAAAPGAHRPTVTVLIAAFNEARHIEATVRNKLEQDYPPGLLDVIVVSDASDDGTDELVRAIGGGRVRLIRQEPRAGKTSALNLAMPRGHRRDHRLLRRQLPLRRRRRGAGWPSALPTATSAT